MKTRSLLLILVFFFTCGLRQQNQAERNMQEKMPVASSDLWQKLATAKIDFDDKKNVFTALVPPEVKVLSGREQSIPGFMLPLESSTKHKHFLLSKRTPTCPYCMPGGPAEVIDVYMKDPINYTDGLLFVTGVFKLVDDSKSGLYFHLENAVTQGDSEPSAAKSKTLPPPV